MKREKTWTSFAIASTLVLVGCKSISQSYETKAGYGEGLLANKNVLFSQSYKELPEVRCFFYGDISWGRTLKGMKKAKRLCAKPYPDAFVSRDAYDKWNEIGSGSEGEELERWRLYRSIERSPQGFDVNAENYKGNFSEADIKDRAEFYMNLCASLPESDFSCPKTFNGKKYLNGDAEEWDINDPSVVPY